MNLFVIKLRDYQHAIIERLYVAWATVMSVLLILPTGAGKTVVFSSVIHEHDGAAAAVVHRKEIVSQIACSLAALGVKHRVVAQPNTVRAIRRKQLAQFGKSYVDPTAPVGVVSVQTLTSRGAANNRDLQRWLGQVTLAVFDEGHHYTRHGLWGRAIEAVGAKCLLLFVTATPDRADGQGLGADADGYVQMMIEGPDTRWMMAQGYLSRFTYHAPTTDLDMSDLPITAKGDVNTQKMKARVKDSHLVGDVVDRYFQFAKGKRTIVFANDVETAEDHARAFRARGVKAVALSGQTDDSVREREVEAFTAGTGVDVLINVDLFDEGFDVAGVEAVLLARVTMSLAKYLQMCGRGLRPVYAPGYDLTTVEGRLAAMAAGPKPKAIIIDMVRNWERHMTPNWPRTWTLEGRETGVRKSPTDMVPQRVCLNPMCCEPYEAFYPCCPYCGLAPVPAERSTPDQVEGDLMELDVEGMAELFAQMQRADMDDDEYRIDQLKRHIPAVGRGADMKRFQASKTRRAVLRELVAWWVGMQPKGREMNEIHRRFYHRFGIDIGLAFTLNAADTDALIKRIELRYTEDLVV